MNSNMSSTSSSYHTCVLAHPIKPHFADNLYTLAKISEGVCCRVMVPAGGMWLALYETRPTMAITGSIFVVACVPSKVFAESFPDDWKLCTAARNYPYQLVIPKHLHARVRFSQAVVFPKGDRTFRQPVTWKIPEFLYESFREQFNTSRKQCLMM